MAGPAAWRVLCLGVAVTALAAAPASAIDTYNLPKQFSGQQGSDGWHYLYGNSPSGPNQAVWDNTISPWGVEPWQSWNGAPRYLYIGGRPVGNWKAPSNAASQMIQTGERSDVSVGWRAPRAGTVHIAAQLNTGEPRSFGGDPYPDDGVWLSIWKGGTKLAGEQHVFHGTTTTNRKPNAFETATTSVGAGDMLYFYVRRGAWQDADYSYYSFTVSYDAGADLAPPTASATASGGKLSLSASDNDSGVAVLEYLPDTPNASWVTYTGPVTVPSGTHLYLYRALDNTGNLGGARQITITGGGTGGGGTGGGGTGGGGTGGGETGGGGTCAKTSVNFWLVTATATCFTEQDGKWVSTGAVRINGLDVTPVGSAKVTIDTSARRIAVTGGTATIKLGSITLYRGSFAWTLDAPNFELAVDGSATIKGFPLTGNAAFSIVQGGVKVDAEVSFESLPGLPGGLTAGVTLRGTMADGLKIDGLKIDIGELPIRGLVLKGASLTYETTDDGRDRWAGEVTAVLPVGSALEVTGGMSFLSPPLQLESISGALGNINKVIYGPIFLQKIGIEIVFQPSLKVAGTIGLTAGPQVLDESALSVDGRLEIALPFGSDPVTVTASGTVTLVVLELANGKIVWKVPGSVTFEGTFGYSFPGIALGASVNGGVTTSAFSAEGTGIADITLFGGTIRLPTAGVILSSRGLASCGGFDIPTLFFGDITVSVGFGMYWGSAPSFKESGCSLGDYRPSGFRRGAGASATSGQVQVPAGQPEVMIGATGTTGPPLVSLTSPSGQRIDMSQGGGKGGIDKGAYVVVTEPQTKNTYFLIAKPTAGTWRVDLGAGSPSALASVGSAQSLPEANVTAKVRRRHGRYSLSWRFGATPGRSVRFSEVTARSTHAITSTAKASGRKRFVPVDDGSRGRRRIVAIVEQRGLPRRQLVVGTFTGPASRRPHRPRPVSFSRRGTRAVARWRAVAGVTRYELRLSVSDGRRHFLTRTPRNRRVVIPRVTRKERVTIRLTAVGRNGLRSKVRISTLRPARRGGGGGGSF